MCIRIYAYSYYTIPSPHLPAALVPICMLSLQADDEASEGVKDEGLEARILSFPVGANINVDDLKVMISRNSRIKLLHIFCI